MIKIFNRDEKVFLGNGEKVLKPFKCVVREEDNGDYLANIECSIEYSKWLTQDTIIVIPLQSKEQAFRVNNLKKTDNKIYIKARHVFFDTETLIIKDAYVVDKNANAALDHLNVATDEVSPFTVLSNIETVSSYRCVRKTLNNAIETVLERWGGHLVRDNFKIEIRKEIGHDKGVTVRYRKNLKKITCEENWDKVATKVLAIGKDGVTIDGEYFYTEVQYDLPYTKVVKFKQDLKQEDYSNKEEYLDALRKDLARQATEYVKDSYLPRLKYKFSAAINAELGDTIKVIDERLGVDILTKVTAVEFDAIQKRVVKVEFGNDFDTLKGFAKNLINQVDKKIEDTETKITENMYIKLAEDLKDSESKIWEAMGSSYVLYDLNRILVVDKLPKEQAKNVLVINNGGIAFGNNGIYGELTSAWTLDGTLNMQAINVINLTADLIKGGTLKLGSHLNQSGVLEIYDEENSLIGKMDKNGLKMLGRDGSYVLINDKVGFAGYNANGNKIYWADKDEFHMKKAVIEEEITLCGKMRFIPITTKNNDGIGLVSIL